MLAGNVTLFVVYINPTQQGGRILIHIFSAYVTFLHTGHTGSFPTIAEVFFVPKTLSLCNHSLQ